MLTARSIVFRFGCHCVSTLARAEYVAIDVRLKRVGDVIVRVDLVLFRDPYLMPRVNG